MIATDLTVLEVRCAHLSHLLARGKHASEELPEDWCLAGEVHQGIRRLLAAEAAMGGLALPADGGARTGVACACPCGFSSQHRMDTVAWRSHHLAAFPAIAADDPGTVRNLIDAVVQAAFREAP